MRSLRDRIRAQLADLRMPGSLEALDPVLSRVDSGLGAGEAISAVLEAQISLRNNRRLDAAMRSSRLPAVKTLTHPALLVVDEIGYLPISRTGAMHFFQLMSRRYEHASTVLTSNKGFEEWGETLGDEIMAAALIDRLLHHCHIVNIRGNSFRMRQHADLWMQLQSPDTDAQTPASEPRRNARRKETTT